MWVIGHPGSAYKNLSGTQVKCIVTINYIVTITIDVITKKM